MDKLKDLFLKKVPTETLLIIYEEKETYGTNKYTTFSLGISLAPNGPTLPYTAYNNITRQMAFSVYEGVKDYGYTSVDRYAWRFGDSGMSIDIWGGVTSAMMLGVNWNGYNDDGHSNPAIFFETRGQVDDMGQKSKGTLIKQNYNGLKVLINSIVNDEMHNVDPTGWSEIPHPEVEYLFGDYGLMPFNGTRPSEDWNETVWEGPPVKPEQE